MGYSKQRQLILRTLGSDRSHPSAEEVYTKLRAVTPQLSLATVYRNLNSLADKGQVRRIRIPGGADRYEVALSEHDHLICEKCGCVVDVPPVDLQGAEDKVAIATGAVVRGHTLTYEGLCPRCASPHDKSSDPGGNPEAEDISST